MFDQLLDGLLILLVLVAFAGGLWLLFKAIAWFAGQPTRALERLDDLDRVAGEEQPVYAAVRQSRRAVARQTNWMGILLVVLAAFVLWCYLDVKTLADLRAAVAQVGTQSLWTIVTFSILMAAWGLYRQLGEGGLPPDLPPAAFISTLFGVSSVATIILVPRIFGTAPLDTIGTELMLNAVVDVCVTFQRSILERWYKNVRRKAQRSM